MIMQNQLEEKAQPATVLPQSKKIEDIIQQLRNEETEYDQSFKKIRDSFVEQSTKLIDEGLQKAQKSFKRTRKTLQEELNALVYYQDHPQEKTIQLGALISRAEQKLTHNHSLINSTTLKINLPHPSPEHTNQQALDSRIKILQSYVAELCKVLNSEPVRRYCKKETQLGDKIRQKYEVQLSNPKKVQFSPVLKYSKTKEGVAQLARHRQVENLTLSLRCSHGILQPQHYSQLLTALSHNRGFLRRLTLQLMDMQFSQQKCDIIRTRILKQFPHLQKLVIRNYYRECKLGQFEDDFQWHPLRKHINVFAGVWSS